MKEGRVRENGKENEIDCGDRMKRREWLEGEEEIIKDRKVWGMVGRIEKSYVELNEVRRWYIIC